MTQTAQQKARFNQLVTQWSTDLYRFSYWLSQDKGLAEELVQETSYAPGRQ